MQDLASELSKIFRGVIHLDPHSYPTPSPAFGRARPGRKRLAVGTQTLVTLNFSAVVAPLVTVNYAC